MNACRRRAAALCTAALLLGPTAAWAQSPLEASVKAAYLVKFLGYVEWPATLAADAPLVLGVLGAESILAQLRLEAAERRIGTRALAVRRLSPGDSLEGVHAVHVGREQSLAALTQALGRRPVLLVSEVPDGLAAGAMLNFVLIDGRVRFEASAAAAERAGLKLSSRLLGVAERVVTP
jgi:YfiR/HmsC-like